MGYRLVLVMLMGAGAGLSCSGSAPQEPSNGTETDPVSDIAVEPAAAPAVLPAEVAPVEDLGSDRPATVSLSLSNSRTYEGDYQASGRARICGNAMRAMNGKVNGFNFEFPVEGDFEIVDVAFAAEELPAGSTTTQYYLSVGVKAKRGGRPPSFVLRTNQPQFHEVGRATRSEEGGTLRIVVEGVNDLGERLQMTAECGPRS